MAETAKAAATHAATYPEATLFMASGRLSCSQATPSSTSTSRGGVAGEEGSPDADAPGVEVETGADRVDPVAVERVADLVEVVVRELGRVVELVVVDQVAEAFDRRAHLVRGRLAGQFGLVAGRDGRVRLQHVSIAIDAASTTRTPPPT